MQTLNQEDIDFIKDLSNTMKSQDNRMTASPYSYRVQQDIVVYGNEEMYSNKGIIIDDERFSMEEAYTHCEEMISDYDWKEQTISNEDELEGFLDENNIEYSYYSWTVEQILCVGNQGGTNSFLTESACEAYIQSNKHNLNNPKSYVVHEYRNPEMEKLQSIIHKLSNVL